MKYTISVTCFMKQSDRLIIADISCIKWGGFMTWIE